MTTIRPARVVDLAATVRLHERRLPSGFFARLGSGFLTRYHASFAASPDATLLVAEEDGEVRGFLAGTFHNGEHYRFVLRRRPVGLVTSGVAALLGDRRLASEFGRTRVGRYARGVTRTLRRRVVAQATTPRGERAAGDALDGDDGTAPIAVLTHVAVDEAAGHGTGRALVARFEADARSAGAGEVRLVTTVRGRATGFYRRLGWRSRGVRRGADGTLVEEFARPL